MAPIHLSVPKRPRAHTNDDTSQKGRNKRLRPSTSTPEPSEIDEYSESGPATHNDEYGSEHAEDDDEEDMVLERQTQAVAKHLQSGENKQNTPAEFGIIEEVRCTNFMCHEQLTVTLGPLINFIIGHNGSGKSAVLTALTLCLGGKATATNRGQNLKSFIKEGKDFCNLSVKIKNRGPSAYKPDLYGDSIIVERHFNKGGSSGFKLKDRNGKLVSTKKAELEDIIDAFALQLDNPMNVLTQDNARQFLNDSNAKDKYKFFLKGTQLENLRGEYDLLKQNTDSQQSKMETLNEDKNHLRKIAEEATKKAKQASGVDAMRKRQTRLTDQMAWARVEDEEQTLRNYEHEIEMVDRIIEERTKDADISSERFDLAHQALSDANQRREDCEAALGPVQDACDELKAKFEDTRNAIKKVGTQEREIIGTLQLKQKAIDSYETQIQEHRQLQAEADNGKHAQKMQELEEAKRELDKAKEAFTNHNSGLTDLEHQRKAAQDRGTPAQSKLQEQRNSEQRYKTAIRSLEQGQRNWIDSYPNPQNLDRLLRLIKENENRFSRGGPPVGPMGRYIKLLKPEWGSILEKQSGASMNAFIVKSKADQMLLSGLMKTAKCQHQHPIYISGGGITAALHEPESHLDTWLRVLKFDNDLVREQMIINHSIEQIVLIRDRKTATDFMHRGGSPRKNVRICFAMSDGDTKKGHSIQVNPNSNAMSINPIIEFTGLGRMQADKESKLKDERNHLARIQQDIRNTMVEVSRLEDEVSRCERLIKDHATQKRRLNLALQRAQERVDKLESELSAATPDAGVIEDLEESLKEVQGEKKFTEDQFEDITNEKDRLNRTARTQKNELDAATQQLTDLKGKLDVAQGKVDKLTSKRATALRHKNDAFQAVTDAQANKAEWEQKRQEQLAVVEEDTSAALTISHPRGRIDVPHGETEESLRRKLEILQQQIVASERELGGSQEELMTRALQAKRAHQAKVNEVASTERLLKVFLRSLRMRDERWHRFKKDIARRARVTFTYLLSERQFRGDLAIDHSNKQLEIHVQPDITVASGSGRQTKTLSGGEKSFSTICLLLSLWDAMGSPIRCLDEFDVFMDSVNRDISMRLMVQAARRAVGRQYILITPQAMNSVKDMHDVKIIRMSDPERGQTTLNIGR